jgi:hypothetical protein
MQKLDFKQINGILLGDPLPYLREWLPDGKVNGKEYIALNPTRDDNSNGSFKINIERGIWSDFASGEKGGDLVSLFAYLNGLEQGAALKRLISEYSLDKVAKKPKVRAGGVVDEEELELVLPVPSDALKPPQKAKINEELREPDRVYEYKDFDGNILCYVYRFEVDGCKEIRPLTLWREKSGRLIWKYKMIPSNRPLYGLDCLARNPNKPVLVVSGEKCVEAVRYHFSQKYNEESDYPFVPVTWSNGDNSIGQSDFRPLLNREVIYWPDNDNSGRTAMATLQAKYTGNILHIERETNNDGWDVADLIKENLENPEFSLAEYIREILAKQSSQAPDLRTPAPVSIFPDKSRSGKLLSTHNNLEALMNFYKIEIKYNVISKRTEYSIGNKAYISVDSANDFYAIVRTLYARNELPKDDIRVYLSYIGNKSFVNPILDWISCKKTFL